MPVNRKGFSLLEVLIAMTISSILLLSTSRFLPGLQRGVLLQSGQQELQDEVWQRLFAVGKQFQRAGYCAGHCQGQGDDHRQARTMCDCAMGCEQQRPVG